MNDIFFNKVTIIGVGLIGSSVARAILHNKITDELCICDNSEKHLSEAKELNIGNTFTTSIAEAVTNSDLIIIAVPVGSFAMVAKEMKSHLKPGAIVSDVGSVKKVMFTDVMPNLPDNVSMIPSHPLAGTENSGPNAGFKELFYNRWCVLTPDMENINQDALHKIDSFWQKLGMKIDIMDAEHHDNILGLTSHLPHLIAWTIVGTAADTEERTQKEVMRFAASGFRDFTRIAASNPTMWTDIFLYNKDAMLEMLGRFSEDLSVLQKAIRNNDEQTIKKHLSRCRDIRVGVIAENQHLPDVKPKK